MKFVLAAISLLAGVSVSVAQAFSCDESGLDPLDAGECIAGDRHHVRRATTDEEEDINLPSDQRKLALDPVFSITPASPTSVSNCIPFGTNTAFGFSGFIYRNILPFELRVGDFIKFDLGSLNNVMTKRTIFFGTANINPTGDTCATNVGSQGVTVNGDGWKEVVDEAHMAQTARKGDMISGNYELTYIAKAPFSFPGGALLIGFRGQPDATLNDDGCQQVLVHTSCDDASSNFYSRFWNKADQELGVLDDIISGSSGANIGGVVIERRPSTRGVAPMDILFCKKRNTINCGGGGTLPVTVFGTAELDVTDIDLATVELCLASDRNVCVTANPSLRRTKVADFGSATDVGSKECAVVDGVEQDYLTQDNISDMTFFWEKQDIINTLLGGCTEICNGSRGPALIFKALTSEGIKLRSTPVSSNTIDQLYIRAGGAECL